MVKCKDCGLLGVRQNYDGEVVEATDLVRSEGKHEALPAKFVCYASSASFPDINHASKHRFSDNGPEKQEAVDANLNAITTDIDCLVHQDWSQGKTPKEHEEMLNRQIIQQLQINQEKHAQQIAALSETHHQENKSDKWLQLWIHIAVTIFGIIASAVAVYFSTLATLGQ